MVQAMSFDETNQIQVPRSFIELFVTPGHTKPREPREFIAERYEWCEDMAQMLCDTATTQLFSLGITEQDVLQRMHQSLQAEGSAFMDCEAGWVVTRLAELLGWPLPRQGERPKGRESPQG
jgi:hypothetical protein